MKLQCSNYSQPKLRRKFWKLALLLVVISMIAATFFAQSENQILQKIWNLNSINFVFLELNDTQYRSDHSRIRHVSNPFASIEIQASGQFLERVRIFNRELDTLISEMRKTLVFNEWKDISLDKEIQLLWTARDDFLQMLGNFPQLKLVMLPWQKNFGKSSEEWTSLTDTSNLLIQKYYQWTADDPLCTWIETPGTIWKKYDVTYNETCYRESNKRTKPQSLKTLTLNIKPLDMDWYWPNNGESFPTHFYIERPPFAFYIYIITNGIVTDYGYVYSGNVKMVQYACDNDIVIKPPTNIHAIRLYDEVFAASQRFGTGVYHRMIDVLPRVALYVDFLKSNPHIKIQASESIGRTAELMKILGIDSDRLISGVFRAKLVYQPRSTMRGMANIQEIQTLSLLYRKYIELNLIRIKNRNKIVLIRRSHSRKFTEQTQIENVVKEAAKSYNLSYVMYKDNPSPNLNATMVMFHSAVLVVGPHGAGLSNIVFSQPGTYVIEGVCNVPYVNMCFNRLAHVLGHRWHGIPSRGGCKRVVNVAADRVTKMIDIYLKQWKNNLP